MLLSPQSYGGKRQFLVVLGLWNQKRFRVWCCGPIPTPDGGLVASSSVGRGMRVVDGSIHYIGCRRFWGWGRSPLRRPYLDLTEVTELKGGLLKSWLPPFLPSVRSHPPNLLPGTHKTLREVSAEQIGFRVSLTSARCVKSDHLLKKLGGENFWKLTRLIVNLGYSLCLLLETKSFH